MKEQKEYSNNKMKIVGADETLSIQPQKEYLKFGRRNFRRKCRMTMSEAKGITLIALVITIIVLLVLAVVSIKLLVDHGIIGHANNATKGHTVEQEKELIAEGYANYKMAKYAATDTTAVETLQKYFDLGLENVLDQEKMENSGNLEFLKNDIIPDADTSLSAIGYGEEEGKYFYRLSYKNKTYKMMVEDEETMKIKIEFESALINSNEETEDLKTLKYYFKAGGIAERKYNGTLELRDNDIIKGTTEIKILGQTMTGYSIQYKNYIYNLIIDNTYSCYDNFEYRGIELSAATFIEDVLNVRGANTKGSEANGWIVTFDKSGNVYTLLSNGKITPGEAQNPETPSIKVNLKELLDKKYAEYGADKELRVAYMEEGPCSNKVEAHIWTYKYNDHYFIMYKSASNNNYIMFLENITVQDFSKISGTTGNVSSNIEEFKQDRWYKMYSPSSTEWVVVEMIMPNSIIFDFSDEHIGDKEVYNAIINNATEMPSRTNLKELANSKFSENNTEEIKVAYAEDGSLMHKELASIRIVKKDTNIIVIFNSKDEETYFMTTENINTKELSTLINKSMDEKNIQPNILHKIGRRVYWDSGSWSHFFPNTVGQVQMPDSILEDFSKEEILDIELYNAIIENLSY